MLLLEYVPRDRATRASYATAFSASLLDPKQPVPSMVTGPNGKGAVKRYNVYRNNVTVSLIDALAALYPAVQRITGVEFFRAMARFYIRKTPPQSPLLFEYGREFPTFIEQYEYALPMPWLADTARIERAWLDAYHAADAAPLSPADLASVPPERLAEAIFPPHPTTRIVRSKFAALTIFAANRSEAPVGAIDAGVDSLAKTRKAALARLRPPPRLALSEWIEANVHLPQAQATPGPMRLWNFQRDIANSIGDASVERVSVLKSARVGCSSLLASVIAYHESADPCAILLLMPTESDARGVMVDDIETLFDASPSLQGLLKSPSRQPTERSTILSRQFPAGSLKVIASHAPRNLRRHSARVLLLDEVDAMEVTHEGDPVALAERRTMSFRDRKICAGSTPTEESTSAILRLYQASDMRIFEVCCPSCGGFAETPLAAYRMAGRRARSGRLQMPRLR